MQVESGCVWVLVKKEEPRDRARGNLTERERKERTDLLSPMETAVLALDTHPCGMH